MLLPVAFPELAVAGNLAEHRLFDHVRLDRLARAGLPAPPLRIGTHIVAISTTQLAAFAEDHGSLTSLTVK